MIMKIYIFLYKGISVSSPLFTLSVIRDMIVFVSCQSGVACVWFLFDISKEPRCSFSEKVPASTIRCVLLLFYNIKSVDWSEFTS